jgi:hypothetical protein
MLVTNFILRNESVRVEVLLSFLGAIELISAQELRREPKRLHIQCSYRIGLDLKTHAKLDKYRKNTELVTHL